MRLTVRGTHTERDDARALSTWIRNASALAEALHSARPSPSASPGGEGGAWTQPDRMRATYTFTLSQALKHAVQRPRTPYYGAFTQVLQSQVHTWLTTDGADAEQTAAGLDAALRKALSGR
ncbi:hypothetical protein [Streptomyces sp. NPDC059460]|uniref:hypothetical protein n=1 Tax=Streptomyces sp. NPDC059460 TaxID=3346840 RepID=UPI00368E20C2